jgi:activator of HSP90 ATPase
MDDSRGNNMKTRTIRQTVTFKAAPMEVYEMLMNSRKHQSLSGEKASMSRKVGGQFTAWDSHITGINLVLNPGERIVQAWRATGWWPNYYSIAVFELEKVGAGTRLRFTQIGVPPNRYSGHYRGWIETYWTPMKEIFANGAVSEKTRARIQTNKTQRIARGQFRRKLTK